MPRPFRCEGCDYEDDTRWLGLCPNCSRIYKVARTRLERDDRSKSLAAALTAKPTEYISTGVPEFDRVLGGGLVLGSSVLLGGPRGSGKSSLLLHTVDSFAMAERKALYVSGEQNRDDILGMAARLGVYNENVEVMGNECDVYKITERAEDYKPKLLIVDSIQVMYMEDTKADVGTAAQVEAVAQWLTSFAKTTKTAVIIVCHINSEGDFAGGQRLQHLVDTLIFISPFDSEGDPEMEEVPGIENVRELVVAGKNRYGADNTRAALEMTAQGLKPVSPKVLRKLGLSRLDLV